MTGLGKEFDIFGPKNGDQLEFRSKMVEFGQNEHKLYRKTTLLVAEV